MPDTPRNWQDIRAAIAMLAGALGPDVDLRLAEASANADGVGPDGVAVDATWHPRTADTGRLRTATLRLAPYDAAADGDRDAAGRRDVVWVLRRGTAAVREALRRDGANFVDLAGAAHVRLPWLLVDRTDLPRHRASTVGRAPVDPFADHNSRVVRTLLDAYWRDPAPRAWGVRALAAAAGVDRTTTSQIVRRLVAWDLVRLEPRGRAVAATLRDPERVLDRWSTRYDWAANAALAVHAPVGDPGRFLGRLPAIFRDRRWALTLQAGASLLAPHAAWDRVHVYVDAADAAELQAVAAAARWTPGADGKVVLLQPHYRATVWEGRQAVRDVWCVSFTQLLVDLWGYPLRGREQAEHLLAVRDRLAPATAPQADTPPARSGDA